MTLHSKVRGDDPFRVPDHADFWARLPLPFTPAEAWQLLSPATQSEFGAGFIGYVLAHYVAGQLVDNEAGRFHDHDLRLGGCQTASQLDAEIGRRLREVLPELLGAPDRHPLWALEGRMLNSLRAATATPDSTPIPLPLEATPVEIAGQTGDAAQGGR